MITIKLLLINLIVSQFIIQTCKSYLCNLTNCITCSSYNKCLECNPNYKLINQKCGKRNLQNSCTVTNCSICSISDSVCSNCITGYTLTNNECSPAINCNVESCRTCNQNSPYICNICIDGYIIDANVCITTAQSDKSKIILFKILDKSDQQLQNVILGAANTTLIMALVIPLMLVVLIVVVVVLAVCCCCKKKPVEDEEDNQGKTLVFNIFRRGCG
jgi:hypothetical protein